MTDEFRMIKGYEGRYWISPFGRVRNQHGRILTPIDLGGGVKAVDLYGHGVRDRKLINVLLTETYPELLEEYNGE